MDVSLYVIAATLQLAAMFFAIRVAREVTDRRPWFVLFAALFLMFAFRIAAPFMPASAREHVSPVASVPISFFLLISLFFIRKVTTAERESNAIAALRTAQRDESEKRYRSLVELSPDAIFVSADRKIVYANPAALRFFGAISDAALIGRSPLEFTAPESKALVESRISQMLEIGQIAPPVGQTWLRLDGSHVPVEATAAVVAWQGGQAIQVILRDISERKRAEDEKSQLLASEQLARAQAEHASRMKDEFLATLSHELRTPLNAILGWSQILRHGPRDAADLEAGLDTIERNTRVQTQLVEDLLDMSRIISGKLRLDIQRVSPDTIIRAAIETLRPTAQAKAIHLEHHLDPAAGPVAADPGRLQQIVWNLLSNAIKFTPRAGHVRVSLQRVESHVQITVTDTGHGIAADFLPYVFDRFRQADASTTRHHGGLGLGLSVVKQLVDLHGGSVHVASPGAGQGATFTVNLPLTAVLASANDQSNQASQTLPPINGQHIDLAGIRVLVVDDEPDAIELIKRVLEDCHATVLTATSANVALELVRQHKPDLLVSDIGMPDRDGYDLIRDIRALFADDDARLPAIALTAFARSEDRTRAMLAGYQVHLAKPIEAQELIATVATLVGRTSRS